jgi:hypothetical protein
MDNTDIASPPSPDKLNRFKLICWARAKLWQLGDYSLSEAVDYCSRIALRDGVAGEFGWDAVQHIMSDAFREVQDD